MGGREDSYWTNRTICDVLEEMRKTHETRNYASLLALIEEAQSMGNRMEAGLEDKRDLIKMHDEWSKLKKEIKELRKEKKELNKTSFTITESEFNERALYGKKNDKDGML